VTQPNVRPTATAVRPLPADLRLDSEGRLPARLWTDNSGQFRVTGRLILILDGKVRLLKETGRTTTVPLDRLSSEDREYIDAVIRQHGADLSRLLLIAAR
jgi:SLA1 Homology Domain 1 (SHD1) protein